MGWCACWLPRMGSGAANRRAVVRRTDCGGKAHQHSSALQSEAAPERLCVCFEGGGVRASMHHATVSVVRVTRLFDVH